MSTSQLIFVDKRTILSLVSRYTASEMPNGFPISRPNITPIESIETNPAIDEDEIIMLVLASAKIGMIIPIVKAISVAAGITYPLV